MRLVHSNDEGLTLVEVIVALLIFSIVAVGVAYSLTSTLTLTRDGRSREVAANLAAEVIDSSRSIEDVFTVQQLPVADQTRVIDGVTYHLTRDAAWVTNNNADAQCGAAGGTSAGGSLEFKRVNVEVTWDGMRAGTTPVRSDTLIAPNSRINDPTLGTIVVSVQSASGSGMQGITVTAAPASVTGNTAAAVTQTILPTDIQGCSYVLKVVPGTYVVTITKTGYVDIDQNQNSANRTVSVTAGTSVSAGFQFDQGATYTANYNAKYNSPILRPSNLSTTFVTTYGNYLSPTAARLLHPWGSGYLAIAGAPAATTTAPNSGCLSPDPANWPIRNDNAVGSRDASATAAPGGAASLDVSMGLVKLSSVKDKYVTAVPEVSSASTDDPGCASQAVGPSGAGYQTYSFGKMANDSPTIALPFGSYKIYTSSNPQTATSLGSVLGSILPILGTNPVNNKVVTLDPRLVP